MDPAYSEDEKDTGTKQDKTSTCQRAGNKRQLNCSLLSLLKMVVGFPAIKLSGKRSMLKVRKEEWLSMQARCVGHLQISKRHVKKLDVLITAERIN